MPIFIDNSELKVTSLLPTIPDSKTSPCLEEVSGADLLISNERFPCTTQALVKRHVENGAILVQGKWSADDLSASLKDGRLGASLARMQAIGARAAQCRLLYTGELEDLDTSSYAAIDKWMDRGGTVSILSDINEVPSWCAIKEKHLAEYASHPLKWVYGQMKGFEMKEEEKLEALLVDELQLLVEVPKDDPRRAIVQCPGIGPELATRWWETLNTQGPATTLFWMLAWMSAEDPKDLPKVEGYAKGKRAKVREWLGLWPGVDLGVTGNIIKCPWYNEPINTREDA